jgi:hypothetical protein
MSHTFGHTKRNHPGVCSYRSAKKYRTEYNQALRCHYRVLVRNAERDPESAVDIILTKIEEIRDQQDHPGDLW